MTRRASIFVGAVAICGIAAAAWTGTPFATHVRPVSASPMTVRLVPAYEECSHREYVTHGPPLTYQACKPPVAESEWLTVGTPDANGLPVKSAGYVTYKVITGNPVTTTNEADIEVTFSLKDVRNKDDLSDYSGELLAIAPWRITDHYNGSTQTEPATTNDNGGVNDGPPIFWTLVSCEETDDPTVGSTCEETVRVNAMLPDAVREGKRMLIEKTGAVEVYDGGSDGDPFGGPANDQTIFAREGLFVP
jgi:hypothetical protein